MSAENAKILLRLDLQSRLSSLNPKFSLKSFELPPVSGDDRDRLLRLVRSLLFGLTRVGCGGAGRDLLADFAELFAFDGEAEGAGYVAKLALINLEQRAAHDEMTYDLSTVRPAAVAGGGGLFFIDGPGGTGKSFLLELLLHHERKDGFVPIVTASTGIASTLLPGCRTAHSRFRIPINITAVSGDQLNAKLVPRQWSIALQ